MHDTRISMKIMLTGIQTLISFQFSLSTETAPQRANKTTTTELIKFYKIKEKEINLLVKNSVKYIHASMICGRVSHVFSSARVEDKHATPKNI